MPTDGVSPNNTLAGGASTSATTHWNSVGAGALMGMIHAVTGPDHMSALVTIAVNQKCAAVWLGIRWGIGHSTGLLLVTGIVLILRDAYDLDQDQMMALFEHGMNWVVGAISSIAES